jgi:alkylation response protein AidB-like acyl-CoA dehydrogenase
MNNSAGVLAHSDQCNAFRQFATEEIAPHASRIDRHGRVPVEMIGRLAALGYLGAIVPADFGGLGLDMVNLGVLHEEIGNACSSVRSLLTVHSMVAYGLSKCGSKQLRDVWLAKLASGEAIGAFALTEVNSGSDAAHIETRAARRGDHFVLNGRKKWITFGQIADVFLVFAQADGGISSLLVEKGCPGFSITHIDGMLGTRGSMLAELHFADCAVPCSNLVGGKGFGFAAVAALCLDFGRYSVACGSVGISQACLDASLAYAEVRKQFGVPIKDHQLIAQLITRMVTDTKAARLLCRHAGQLKDVGDPETVNETLVAKYFASRAAMRSASDAVQIHGANGCSSDYPVERLFRDAKIMEIIEGSSQMQEIMIARHSYNNRGASRGR